MITQLRPYQRLVLYHLRRCLEAGVQRQYVDLPTGTGKSTIATAFAVQQQAHGRLLGLVHRQDLALQLAETLRQAGLEVGLVMQGHRTVSTPIVVATIQSLTPEVTGDLLAASPIPCLTVLIDEAHHAVPGYAVSRGSGLGAHFGQLATQRQRRITDDMPLTNCLAPLRFPFSTRPTQGEKENGKSRFAS